MPAFLVGPKSVVLGYERVLKPYRSFTINLGYLEKSPLKDAEGVPIKIFDQSSKGGFDFSADFRFYSKKRNRRHAPDGLYWGPYVSYYGVWQEGTINLFDDLGTIKNTVTFDGKFSMYSAGVQLGYQFVFKNRITMDLILFGPSLSFYSLDMGLKFKTEIDPDDPFYDDLMYFLEHSNGFLANFIRNQGFSSSGRLSFAYYGFRYAFQVGYNF